MTHTTTDATGVDDKTTAPREPTDGKMVATRNRRMARTGWIYTSPALVVIALVTIFPIVFSVVLSFNNVQQTGNGFQLNGFTLGNYSTMVHASQYWHALAFTVVYTIITVVVEMILGVLCALVLERLGAARGWMMALLLIPWSMITVISAQLWKYIYDGTFGVATYLLDAMFGTKPVILGSSVSATSAMMVADIWKTTPFVAIIVLAGLVMLPQDCYEAADVDGAGAWVTFWKIVLPQLRPALAIAVLFRILQAFGLFDLPYVLTGGGPGDSTVSLAILARNTIFNDLEIGPGTAVATSAGVVVLVVCLLFLRAFRAQVGEEN